MLVRYNRRKYPSDSKPRRGHHFVSHARKIKSFQSTRIPSQRLLQIRGNDPRETVGFLPHTIDCGHALCDTLITGARATVESPAVQVLHRRTEQKFSNSGDRKQIIWKVVSHTGVPEKIISSFFANSPTACWFACGRKTAMFGVLRG